MTKKKVREQVTMRTVMCACGHEVETSGSDKIALCPNCRFSALFGSKIEIKYLELLPDDILIADEKGNPMYTDTYIAKMKELYSNNTKPNQVFTRPEIKLAMNHSFGISQYMLNAVNGFIGALDEIQKLRARIAALEKPTEDA